MMMMITTATTHFGKLESRLFYRFCLERARLGGITNRYSSSSSTFSSYNNNNNNDYPSLLKTSRSSRKTTTTMATTASFSSMTATTAAATTTTATATAAAPARVVVVGSGRMGQIRSNLINSNPRFELEGIVDNVLENAETLSQKYRVSSYQNLSSVLQEHHHHQLDGIICCSPTLAHREIIEQAIEEGIDIFVEKPVDASAEKIESLFELVEEKQQQQQQKNNNVPMQLCCGFQRRFDPSYKQALEYIHAGKIGIPISASIFFGDHPVPPKEFLLQGGGDIFMDLSAHDVDYILQAFQGQNVSSVYAVGTSSTTELEQANVHDNATMVLKLSPSGVVVTLFMSRSASYGYDQRCEIFGSHGRIQVGNIHETSTILSTSDGILASKYQHSFPQRFHQAFGNELDAFADTILLNKPWPITKQDCIRVQRIADAAQLSQKTGQVVEI